MLKKPIPKELAELQKNIKDQTLGKIQKAIDDLKAEGFIVTKKLLIERTEFSPSLFSKLHVKELLKENSVCQFKNRKIISRTTVNIEATVAQLEAGLDAAHKKISLLEKKADERNQYTHKLEAKLHDKTRENELLRGQLFVLVEKAKIFGINLEE